MVFLNFPCRETPKNVPPKKSQGKKKVGWWDGGWVGLRCSKCTGGVRRFFVAGPSSSNSLCLAQWACFCVSVRDVEFAIRFLVPCDITAVRPWEVGPEGLLLVTSYQLVKMQDGRLGYYVSTRTRMRVSGICMLYGLWAWGLGGNISFFLHSQVATRITKN
jgi:hypothetical protein